MQKTTNGYSLTLIPAAWALGRWFKGHKTIWAFGPFRFTHHRIRAAGAFGEGQ